MSNNFEDEKSGRCEDKCQPDGNGDTIKTSIEPYLQELVNAYQLGTNFEICFLYFKQDISKSKSISIYNSNISVENAIKTQKFLFAIFSEGVVMSGLEQSNHISSLPNDKNEFLPKNHGFSQFIIHPLKISNFEQKAYIGLANISKDLRIRHLEINFLHTLLKLSSFPIELGIGYGLLDNSSGIDRNQMLKGIEEITKTNIGLKKQVSLLLQESKQIEKRAQFDQLTGLLNRGAIEFKIVEQIKAHGRNNTKLAIVLLDLDQFKIINDSLGHKMGDDLLKEVSKRIQLQVKESDITGRLGGDEFVVILNEIDNLDNVKKNLKSILDAVSTPLKLGHREVKITLSIGFSVFPDDGEDAETLLRYADSAMYQVKKAGKNNFQYFSPELNNQLKNRIELEKELAEALQKNQFVLFYQPQVDIISGEIVGMEALIRWSHPLKGLIYPDEFIPLAEEVGLIVEMGDWVIGEVFRQIKKWQMLEIEVIPVSINVSVKQLEQIDFTKYLRRTIRDFEIAPNLITLEITESLSLGEGTKYLPTLDEIKSIGMSISMDDFGEGYSNFSYLKKFPIDEIKIDKGFIDKIVSNPKDKEITKTIITVAKSFGLKVIAEGVETKAQLSILAAQRCDIIQGYYFSKPLSELDSTKCLLDKRKMSLKGISLVNHTRTLLLVDDEKYILKVLERILRKTNVCILTAGSGKEALEILALNKVSVILSDLSMPHLNGIELLNKVRQMYPDVIRMILSGRNEFELACEAINRSSIHRFITKPWSDENLKQEINSAFEFYETSLATKTTEKAR